MSNRKRVKEIQSLTDYDFTTAKCCLYGKTNKLCEGEENREEWSASPFSPCIVFGVVHPREMSCTHTHTPLRVVCLLLLAPSPTRAVLALTLRGFSSPLYYQTVLTPSPKDIPKAIPSFGCCSHYGEQGTTMHTHIITFTYICISA
jgi:hypothetical protein